MGKKHLARIKKLVFSKEERKLATEANIDIAMQWYLKFSEEDQTKIRNGYIDKVLGSKSLSFEQFVVVCYNVAKTTTKNGTKKTDMWGKKLE